MNTRYQILIVAALLGWVASYGQSSSEINLDMLMAKALEQNHQIQIIKNNQEIAENNVNPGMAGLLPTVGISASSGVSVQDSKLEFAGGFPPTDVQGAQSINNSAAASLNYTVFNGFNGRYQYQKLKLLKTAVDAQSRAAIEATILQLAQAYYNFVRANDLENIAKENAALSLRRVQRIEVANQLGTALRTELLNAQVALTSDSASLIQAQLNKRNALRMIERLCNTELEDSSQPEAIQIELQEWTEASLINLAETNNAAVKNAEIQKEIAMRDVKLSKASLYPTINVGGGYSINQSINEVGVLLESNTRGFNGNLSLNYPLFTGYRNRIQRQNQQILLETREEELMDASAQLQLDISTAWQGYQTNLELYRIERANQKAAELNLDRSEALYSSGNITSTQFREAQLGLAMSRDRLSAAKVNLKLSELTLLRLTGQLLGG